MLYNSILLSSKNCNTTCEKISQKSHTEDKTIKRVENLKNKKS